MIISPVILKFSSNLQIMPVCLLRVFLCLFLFWGLSEQIRLMKHFALPKIRASQSSAYSHSKDDVINNSQEKRTETATNTSKISLHIDLSQLCTPTPPSESMEISGLQIYKDDVQTVQPKSMITDTIVSFLFK